MKDTQVWRSDEYDCFSVSSAFECLSKPERGPQKEVFTLLWKVKTFPNVMLTAWRALLGRIPIRLCLSRRETVMNSTMCALCLSAKESCQHLFVECDHALRVWTMGFKWIGILFVQHNEITAHFNNFYLLNGSRKQNLVWKRV